MQGGHHFQLPKHHRFHRQYQGRPQVQVSPKEGQRQKTGGSATFFWNPDGRKKENIKSRFKEQSIAKGVGHIQLYSHQLASLMNF